jgi:hypothetical protein
MVPYAMRPAAMEARAVTHLQTSVLRIAPAYRNGTSRVARNLLSQHFASGLWHGRDKTICMSGPAGL